jgi:hypothetical protein
LQLAGICKLDGDAGKRFLRPLGARLIADYNYQLPSGGFMNTEPHIDQNAIADNIERTVQRTALRKVRKLADELTAEEAAKLRLEKRALIIAIVAGAVATLWLVSSLIASDEKFERGQSIQLPAKITVPKKD